MQLNLTHVQRMEILARIAFELTIGARTTYEAGTDDVLAPRVLRAYNDLQHRVAGAVLSHINNSDDFSLETIVEMIRNFGLRQNQVAEMNFALSRAFKNTGISE